MIYLVDIDGTLADITHRLHFIKGEEQDWDAFFEACDQDAPIWEVIDTIKLLAKAGAEMLMLSGRAERVRMKTLAWFRTYGVPCDALYLREDDDHRPDHIVKGEQLDHVLTKWDGRLIRGAFEDRKQVVDMYRARGIKVFQVAEGNF